MARYTGPKTKIARKFNNPIFGPSKALQKKKLSPWSTWAEQMLKAV